MPSVVDYPLVLARLESQGLHCNYHNSGAFGFNDSASSNVLAWIGPDDATIRESARPLVRRVGQPYPLTLAVLALHLWRDHLGVGPAWVMPMSHWAFELDHGHRDWMPAALRGIGIDPEPLASLNNAAAIQFEWTESPAFERFVEQLLTHLKGSDFAMAFPGRNVLCTIHHHQQLWWMTTDPNLLVAAEALAAHSLVI